jgi:hypothetical protein
MPVARSTPNAGIGELFGASSVGAALTARLDGQPFMAHFGNSRPSLDCSAPHFVPQRLVFLY